MITFNHVKKTIRFKYHIFMTDVALAFARRHMRDDNDDRYWYWMRKIILHLNKCGVF